MNEYNFLELSLEESMEISAGGGLGRVIGWILGLPEGYVRHAQNNSDMSASLMNCM